MSAGLRVVGFVFAFLGAGSLPQGLRLAFDPAVAAPFRLFVVPFALVLIVSGIGLWLHQKWARPLAMAGATIAVVGTLATMLLAPPGAQTFLAIMFLAAMLSALVYLQRPHVRAALR